jgi:hypothetical protein
VWGRLLNAWCPFVRYFVSRVMSGKYLSRAPVVWRAHLHNILGSLSDLASSYNKRACSGQPLSLLPFLCVCARLRGVRELSISLDRDWLFF